MKAAVIAAAVILWIVVLLCACRAAGRCDRQMDEFFKRH